MSKLKLMVMLFTFTTVLFVGLDAYAAEGASIAIETQRFDGSILKSVLMQKGNKIRLEENLPNSEEVGNVIISDGKECWHIPVIGKPQKYPPIKNALELIGIDKEAIKKEPTGKIAEKIQKTGNKKEIIRYKDFMETEDLGWLPRTIETYDSAQVLQTRTEIKETNDVVELQDDLFNYRNVKFSQKAKEIAKKMHFE